MPLHLMRDEQYAALHDYDEGLAYTRRLRLARRRAGMSVRTLGRRAGIPKRRLCDVEAGRGGLSAEEAGLVAAVLRVPVWWLC